jgi:hypothetical protein
VLECPQTASPRPALPSPAASSVPEDSNSTPWPVPIRAEEPAAPGEPSSAAEAGLLAPGIEADWQQAALCLQCGSVIAEGATLCPVCQKEPSWPPHDSYLGPDPENS